MENRGEYAIRYGYGIKVQRNNIIYELSPHYGFKAFSLDSWVVGSNKYISHYKEIPLDRVMRIFNFLKENDRTHLRLIKDDFEKTLEIEELNKKIKELYKEITELKVKNENY